MDAKFGFDDNADFRQKDVFKLRDVTQEDPQEVEAAEVRDTGAKCIVPSR
jgi:succinyl-CoA synthetase beta subunit